jgi:hypothetical protein
MLLLLDAQNLRRTPGGTLDRRIAEYKNSYSGETSPQLHESTPDLTGSVTGSLVDDRDAPIRGIEVELIPLEKVGDQRWYATKHDWTNIQGQYIFSGVQPGEYILAVQESGAPDGQHPFAGTYYPGVDAESDADHVYIAATSAIELHPLRLRRIETTVLKIEVEFEDGTRPTWSNLLFHNLDFPNQAVIGNEAPGVEDGKGEFTLPMGFDYYASAKVDCDGAASIESRESPRLHVRNGNFPDELIFIIPGTPCPLWSPK